MNKKLLIFAGLVLLVILSVATVIAVAKTDLVRFEVVNKSDMPVSISLIEESAFYYLTVAPDSTKIFTVERLDYDFTIWSCEGTESGTVDLKTYLKLVFTACGGSAANNGEPGHEKVHIDDAPYGVNYRFQYSND